MAMTLTELRVEMKQFAGDTSIDNTLADSFINQAYTGNVFFDALPRQTLFDMYGTDTKVELQMDSVYKFYFLDIPKANLHVFESNIEPVDRASDAVNIRLFYPVKDIQYSAFYNTVTKLTDPSDATVLVRDHDYLLAMKSAELYCLTYNENDKAQALEALFIKRLADRPQVIRQKFIPYASS